MQAVAIDYRKAENFLDLIADELDKTCIVQHPEYGCCVIVEAHGDHLIVEGFSDRSAAHAWELRLVERARERGREVVPVQ